MMDVYNAAAVGPAAVSSPPGQETINHCSADQFGLVGLAGRAVPCTALAAPWLQPLQPLDRCMAL